ncbi:hypothetical protein [Tengunoibacter tsumagoiensis]|uniref:GAF domain-containing protein n=1 Tax=Tengunoibacter tsumagoiensis TaxID=2014871 RepID=A0A401ZWD9_9CHLR|nr:hypothetical protein [Tengunoibacter tsumagoiensis]GCE11198.1 hypothetical protein KTT_10570 [Tengunoibacter tsumagoiensis]
MSEGFAADTQSQSKRKRPAGTSSIRTKRVRTSSTISKISPYPTPSMENEDCRTLARQEEGLQGEEGQSSRKNRRDATPFSNTLNTILHRDRAELKRVARALEVTENTIYRWMNGSSDHPRQIHLKRLPEVLQDHSQQLILAIQQTFGNVVEESQPQPGEVHRELYQEILKLFIANDDQHNRFWQIAQTLCGQALDLLDPEQKGLAITYARLSPPHEDGIHSLREVVTYGRHPWQDKQESKAYLGSTSLAGTAASLQRLQTWNSIESNQRVLVEVDTYEKSACAVPLCRGNTIAGVFIVSSTQPDFFHQPLICNTVAELAILLNVALSSSDFYAFSLLNLRPMPGLHWQRRQLAQSYNERIVAYASKYATSRRQAELCVQKEIELSFEQEASRMS